MLIVIVVWVTLLGFILEAHHLHLSAYFLQTVDILLNSFKTFPVSYRGRRSSHPSTTNIHWLSLLVSCR